MIPRVKKSKTIPFGHAVHEAGHAGAEWLLGCLPYAVHILAPGQEITDRRGRTLRQVGGFVETGLPYNVYGDPPNYLRLADKPEYLIGARHYGLAAAASLFAGPVAEARYRHGSLLAVMMYGGEDDWRQIKAIAADLYPDADGQRRFRSVAETLARRLLRGRLPAIVSLAHELHRAGTLDGRLRDLLLELLGPRPEFLAAVTNAGLPKNMLVGVGVPA
jgi:hypothetical protein